MYKLEKLIMPHFLLYQNASLPKKICYANEAMCDRLRKGRKLLIGNHYETEVAPMMWQPFVSQAKRGNL